MRSQAAGSFPGNLSRLPKPSSQHAGPSSASETRDLTFAVGWGKVCKRENCSFKAKCFSFSCLQKSQDFHVESAHTNPSKSLDISP